MVSSLGSFLINIQISITAIFEMLLQVFYRLITPPIRIKETIEQFHFVANKSLWIIVFSVSFAAVVTILEASFHMKLVIQNDAMVPGFAALLILRELGVVVTALLLTSRVGAGLSAEVGSMKITEQIDALKLLGIDPIRFIVIPRFIACVLGGLVLSLVANVVCLFCAMLVSKFSLGYTTSTFILAMNRFVDFKDLFFAGIKGAVFGGIIPLVSCFYGFRCQSGAEGVGRATTNSVVAASMLIIFSDFILSWFFTNFY